MCLLLLMAEYIIDLIFIYLNMINSEFNDFIISMFYYFAQKYLNKYLYIGFNHWQRIQNIL